MSYADIQPADLHLPPDVRFLLVSDFDGTIMQGDFFDRALSHVDRKHMPDYWGEYVAGRLSHFEALRGIFSHLRGGEEAIMRIAREAGIDPALGEAIARLREAGWGVVVVSAGCTWYIERLLAEAGVELLVISNDGRIGENGCLEMLLPANSPFFSQQVGVDKAAVVRWALKWFENVAFAGDGRPDEQPARLVPNECRFARGWLAERFRSDGTPFQSFDLWSEIAGKLAAPSG